MLRRSRYVRVRIARPTVTRVARSRTPSVRRVSTASPVLWVRPTPAHRPRNFAYAYMRGAVGMRRPHGVIYTPSRRHAPCFHVLRPTIPPQSRMGWSHRASPSFRRVAVAGRHRRIDGFGPADSHPPLPHAQGATLLARPRGDAVGFALRVAVAFAGRGLSPPLRCLAFAFSRPVPPFGNFDIPLFANKQ